MKSLPPFATVLGSLAIAAMAAGAFDAHAARPSVGEIQDDGSRDGESRYGESRDEVRETFYFEAPGDGIAATHDGTKPIQAFPKGIAPLDDKGLESAFILVAKARDKDGRIVGFASEMEDVAPESDIAKGRMIMHSTWTIELPGRGTLFCFEVEDASEFAKKVVIPAFTHGKAWEEPWTFVTTIGPTRDGRGVIIGGTGEFEGVSGTFKEVTHLRRFTPDGQMHLTMELQLAYTRPALAHASASRRP